MGKKGTAERGKSKKALQKARVLKAEAGKVASASKKADRAAKREAKKAAARKRGKQTKDEDAEVRGKPPAAPRRACRRRC